MGTWFNNSRNSFSASSKLFVESHRELLARMSCDKEDDESRVVIKKRGLRMVSERGSTAPPEALRFGARILNIIGKQCDKPPMLQSHVLAPHLVRI